MASVPPRPAQPPVPRPRAARSNVTPKTEAPSYPPPPRPTEGPGVAPVRTTPPHPSHPPVTARRSLVDVAAISTTPTSPGHATPTSPAAVVSPRRMNAEIAYEDPVSIHDQGRQLQEQDEESTNRSHGDIEGGSRAEAGGVREEVRLRSKTEGHQVHSHLHTDIDADLRCKSEYINVENLAPIDADDGIDNDDDDDDDEDGEITKVGFTGFAIHGSRTGHNPSIKLHSHPAMRKSLSLMEDDINPTATPMAHLIMQATKRPKNRAPPPPPSSSTAPSGSKPGGGASKQPENMAVSAQKPPTGHKRSKSAQLLDSGNFGEAQAQAEIIAEADRRSPLDDTQGGRRGRRAGHLSPAPSPPPQAVAGRRSPKQQSGDGARSPKDIRSKSPSQQQKQANRKSSAEGVADATPAGNKRVSYPPPLNPVVKPHPPLAARHSTAADSQPSITSNSTTSTSSGQPAKKPKVGIPSRPPPPPERTPRQQLPSKATPPPAPPNKPVPSQQPMTANVSKAQSNVPAAAASKESVRGHQPVAASSGAAAPKKRPAGAQGSDSPGENASPSVKPKRHAPPPPAGVTQRISPHASPLQGRGAVQMENPPPNYAEVMQQDKAKGVSGVGGAAKRGGVAASGEGVAPKPARRVQQLPAEVQATPSQPQAIPAPSQATPLPSQVTPTSPVSPPLSPPLSPSYDPYEEVLRTMDLLTIELRRNEGSEQEELGLEIASGKVRTGLGDVADGVFVKHIRRGSPAEQDGRIQTGDMLVRVCGYDIRRDIGSAHQQLSQPAISVRVKVGRPDITSSIFSVHNGVEEPIYTSQLVGTTYDDLLEKLERTRVRADESERQKESAIQQLEDYRSETQLERENLVKELEETKQAFVAYKDQSEVRQTELTQTVASISVAKTKVDSELECHRDKLRELQEQLEQEKTKAEQDLQLIREKLMETQDKMSKRDEDMLNKSTESEQKLQELNDEISKYKEDSSKMWTELVAEKEKVTDLEERLKSTQADLLAEKELNAKMEKSLEEKTTEISKLQSEINELRTELAQSKSSSTAKEAVDNSELVDKPAPLVPSRIKKREPSPVPARPDTPLSEEDIPVQNGEMPSEEDSDKEDAFDKGSPSPQVPYPYVDFVPLQMDSKDESPKKTNTEKKSTEEKLEKKSDIQKDEEQSNEVKEKEDEKEREEEPEEEPQEEPEVVQADKEASTEDKLDNSATSDNGKNEDEAALKDTSESTVPVVTKEEDVSEEEVEKDSHVDDSTDTGGEKLEDVPKEVESAQEGDEEEEEKSEIKPEVKPEVERAPSPDLSELIKPHKILDNSAAVHRSRISSVFKRKLPSRDHLRKKDSCGNILHNMPESMLSNLETPLEETTPEPEDKGEEDVGKSTPQPKPKPRAVPRKKPVPTPSEQSKEVKKPPQAAPRTRQSSIDVIEDSPTKSNSAPDASTEEGRENDASKDTDHPPPVATRSPPSVGHKPTPKRAPVPTPSTRPRIGSSDESGSLSPEKKDPANLTIKERALLAQKVFESPGEKPKPGGPPIPRKPKQPVPTPSESSSDAAQPTATESVGSSPQRGAALTTAPGEASTSSPVPKRKLPPGAVSIIGGVSVFGPPPTANRNRTGTASSRDHNKEDASEEASCPSQDVSPEYPKSHSDQHLDSENVRDANGESDSKPAVEEDNPPVVPEEATPSTEPKDLSAENPDVPDGGEAPEVNNEVVLTWTPDVTAAWLKQIGLGSYVQAFLEKEIHGNMLFDIDAHKLKGIGLTSHDDRNTFKKEVKNLKSFADKQKKLLEKQKKEEEKQKKEEKKQAKKKKK